MSEVAVGNLLVSLVEHCSCSGVQAYVDGSKTEHHSDAKAAVARYLAYKGRKLYFGVHWRGQHVVNVRERP